MTIARAVPAILLALALPLGAQAQRAESAALRPAADPGAMQDAILGMAGGEERAYSSPHAYRHYLLARVAETAGDLPRALVELEQAAAYDADSAELRLALGRLHARLGNLEQAEQEMERAMAALEATPDDELRSSIERELRSLRMAKLASP